MAKEQFRQEVPARLSRLHQQEDQRQQEGDGDPRGPNPYAYGAQECDLFPPAPDFLFQPPASYGPKNWPESIGPQSRFTRRHFSDTPATAS